MLKNFEKIYAPVLTGKENLSHKEVQVLCPFHNDKQESMSINTESGLYYCFACGAKGSAIGFYMKTRNVDYKTALKELGEFDNNYKPKHNYITKNVSNQSKTEHKNKEINPEFEKFVIKAYNNVFNNYEFFCKKLYDLRGITLPTAIICMIGYDKSKGWIFPIIRYPDYKCVGYEIRQKNFQLFDFNKSKCYKESGSHSCLSIVCAGTENKKAIVCEGFIDAYKMFQYLHEKAQMTEKNELATVKETILTPSNGVKTIPELVMELKLWNDFDEVLFVLDNDKPKWNEKEQRWIAAGPDTVKELMNFPHEGKFKFFGGLEEGEDFENWYDRKVVKS